MEMSHEALDCGVGCCDGCPAHIAARAWVRELEAPTERYFRPNHSILLSGSQCVITKSFLHCFYLFSTTTLFGGRFKTEKTLAITPEE